MLGCMQTQVKIHCQMVPKKMGSGHMLAPRNDIAVFHTCSRTPEVTPAASATSCSVAQGFCFSIATILDQRSHAMRDMPDAPALWRRPLSGTWPAVINRLA